MRETFSVFMAHRGKRLLLVRSLPTIADAIRAARELASQRGEQLDGMFVASDQTRTQYDLGTATVAALLVEDAASRLARQLDASARAIDRARAAHERALAAAERARALNELDPVGAGERLLPLVAQFERTAEAVGASIEALQAHATSAPWGSILHARKK